MLQALDLTQMTMLFFEKLIALGAKPFVLASKLIQGCRRSVRILRDHDYIIQDTKCPATSSRCIEDLSGCIPDDGTAADA